MTNHPLTATPAAPTQAAIMSTHWAQHLMAPGAGGHKQPALSPHEAARVQRHRDQLLAALQAQDRRALLCAKQEVLADAFCQGNAGGEAQGALDARDSAALRSALRDLTWRMAGLLLPRSPCH